MRRYRCPYCKHEFTEAPAGGKCAECGKLMRLPPGVGQTVDLRARKRKIERIHREADRRLKEVHAAPDLHPGRNPRVLLVVAAVFLVLAALFVRKDQEAENRPHRSPITKTIGDLQVLSQATGRFHFHVGRYPTEEEGLYALIDGRHIDGWRGSSIKGVLHPDSWKTPYAYLLSNGVPLIFSAGPDGLTNTADDIHADLLDLDPGTDWTNNWYRPSIRYYSVD